MVLKSLARVYLVISWVTVKMPYAPDPLACTTRSGMRSRLKCAIFSNNRKSSRTIGPRSPRVTEFWLSPTGRPASDVITLLFVSAMLYLEYNGYANQTHSLLEGCQSRFSGPSLCFIDTSHTPRSHPPHSVPPESRRPAASFSAASPGPPRRCP